MESGKELLHPEAKSSWETLRMGERKDGFRILSAASLPVGLRSRE